MPKKCSKKKPSFTVVANKNHDLYAEEDSVKTNNNPEEETENNKDSVEVFGSLWDRLNNFGSNIFNKYTCNTISTITKYYFSVGRKWYYSLPSCCMKTEDTSHSKLAIFCQLVSLMDTCNYQNMQKYQFDLINYQNIESQKRESQRC